MVGDASVAVLAAGCSAVPPGHVAAVITSLEMVAAPATPHGARFPPGCGLEALGPSDVDLYRRLFRDVGQDWLWFSRLAASDGELAAVLGDPGVEALALRRDRAGIGILELDFRRPGACEMTYFGLVPSAIGRGIGRALMAEAVRRAWSRPIGRFWLHTCTFDHPGALGFYRRSGFEPCAVRVEVAPDPRLTGALPRDCAGHVPLLGEAGPRPARG